MKLEESFEVAASPDAVWDALIDVERVAPCLPGASVTARNGDGSYEAEFRVKIGPTSAAYGGRLTVDEIDSDARRSTMRAAGTDARGQGGAKTTIVSTVTPAGDGARVVVSSDYQITGRLARFGRGGMIEEISGRLVSEFAANLQELLAAGSPLDAVMEGALPVAEPVATHQPPPEPEPAVTHQPPPPRPPREPASAPDPTGAVAVRRARDNAAPLAALVAGFLLALRVLRRRS